MVKTNSLIIALLMTTVLLTGCVQRKLTINTSPQGAMVELNDEPIGYSPVTVGFNFYGDYSVKLTKEGYETINTHRRLKGPWYDKFPADFFAEVLWPKTKIDSYEWTFDLEPQRVIEPNELIENARQFREKARAELP